MSPRLSALTLFALLVLSWNVSAQRRATPSVPRASGAQQFGSVARTKLLNQVRGRGAVDTLRLGSIQRRALLTGATVQVNKPTRRNPR